jgi:hypothetical protein
MLGSDSIIAHPSTLQTYDLPLPASWNSYIFNGHSAFQSHKGTIVNNLSLVASNFSLSYLSPSKAEHSRGFANQWPLSCDGASAALESHKAFE